MNCSFYFKIGACRHGDRCSRLHNKPAFSQTILISNMYQNPTHITGNTLTEEQLQLHFELFFEDVFTELAVNYGEVEEMYVCDNVGDHLIGNVYVRFRYEEDAQKAVDSLNSRFYAGTCEGGWPGVVGECRAGVGGRGGSLQTLALGLGLWTPVDTRPWGCAFGRLWTLGPGVAPLDARVEVRLTRCVPCDPAPRARFAHQAVRSLPSSRR